MKKTRYALAALALAGAVAPLTAQPAQAMMCAPGFEALCFVLGTACQAVDSTKFGCELG